MKKDTGFTLIELLITLSMIGFVITAVYSFYLAGLSGWQRALDQAEYQQSARIAMDKVVRELINAREISLHRQGREIRFKVHGDSRTLRFRLVGPQLVYDVHPTTNPIYFHNVVALHITDLSFSINANRLITVMIGAGPFDPESGAAQGTAYQLISTVYPRNLPQAAVAVPVEAKTDRAGEAGG